MARKNIKEVEASETAHRDQNSKQAVGHVFYSVHSQSRGGFIAEYLDVEKACETVDIMWFNHRRNLMTGKWDRRIFDVYIMKRDTNICHTNCQIYDYCPGTLTEARRRKKLRERYGDDYNEDEDMENFDDYSNYM